MIPSAKSAVLRATRISNRAFGSGLLLFSTLGAKSLRPEHETPRFDLSVTVDFPDDITKGPFDRARLDEQILAIRDIGARRVNWMYYGGIDADDPGRGNVWQSHWALYGPETIANIGEPLKAAVHAAHAQGLEIFGVLKPYNGGLSGTYPTGSPELDRSSKLTRIGGTVQQAIPFLQAHPEMRLQRRPESAAVSGAGRISEIRLIKADDGRTRLEPKHIRIWTSADNYRYKPLSLVPRGTVEVEPSQREVRDYHGNVLTRVGDPVRVVCLTNLDVTARFVVLSTVFAEGAGDFKNTPVGMVEVLDGDRRPLPCVLATHAALWIRPRDFRTYGLEFDMGYGHLPVTLDEPWKGSGGDPFEPFSGEDEFAEETLFGKGPIGGFIGIALGKNEYLAAVPCEAYPEVRTLWLHWIAQMLDAGVDGVNLRISAHGCLSDEPEAYGWNPPILAAYRKKYGDAPVDLSKLAEIRGAFYTQFLRDASKLVHARGKKLQLHFHAEAFRPDRVFGQQNGVPANIDFQWRQWLDEGLADEIYLRTSWFEAAEDPLGAKSTQRSRLTAALKDPIVEEMLASANRHRLPVTLNRYIGRAAGLEEYLNDLEQISRDKRFSGFDVYEFFDLAQSSPTEKRLVPRLERISGLKARWQAIQAKP